MIIQPHSTFEFDTQHHSIFSGYASIFNLQDKQRDIILKGAFKKTLAKNTRFYLLWEHDPRKIIGTVKANEDMRGLFVNGNIDLLSTHSILAYELLKNMSVNHMSIGYQVVNYYIKNNVRYIKELILHEVSIVQYPSNSGAKVYTLV